MNTCKTCKHRQPFDYGTLVGSKCAKMDSEDGKPMDEKTLAYGLDHDDFQSSVVVMLEFGCVMWEGKE